MTPRTRRVFERHSGSWLAVAVLAAAAPAGLGSRAAAQTYAWVEAEKPASANFELKIERGPHGELMSGGAWLNGGLSKEEVDAGALGDGRMVTYEPNVPKAGQYRLWIRLGFEFVRAPLTWRLDDGDWLPIAPTDLTTNLIGLSPWCELGWRDCGLVDLTAGPHRLAIRGTQAGQDGRFLVALDCIALAPPDWLPDAQLKPGETPNDEIDRQAAEHVFRLTDAQAAAGARLVLSLVGPWQVCRHDDTDMDQSSYEPVSDMPAKPIWRGIPVPSSLAAVPALDLAHRVWYRCRVDVPAGLAGRSFVLDFTGTNWIASVVVNGQMVASHKSTRVPWQADITRAVKPGQVNEIRIGIKDVWYAIDARFHKKSLDETRNIPTTHFQWTRFVAPVYPSTKGDADGTVCGITDPVDLLVCGPSYVSGVFVRTSVAEKRATAEVSVADPGDAPATLSLRGEAIFEGSGQVEKEFGPVEVTVAPRGTKTVTLAADWPDAKLWWPDQDPANMYRLRLTLSQGGRPVDVSEQRFGFRDVTIDGVYIRVNGLRRNFWNLLGGLDGQTEQERLANFRAGNNRFERFSDDLRLRDAIGPRRARLDWFDTHGIAGRLSTMIDGMFINYDLSNPVVWENFREHCRQVALAYRNHPSIIVYSLENELVLINGRLGYRGILDQVEANAKTLVEAAHEVDPTRPCMLDGAGALKDNSLEINCLHYPEAADEFYPENAYTLERYGDFGERWKWDRKRPLAMGEIAFFAGKNSQQAWVGGDDVFRGREEATRAAAKHIRTLIEGYRWQDVAMICPWCGASQMPETRTSMSPLAAFVREHGTSFFGGVRTKRTIKVFNDTFSAEPVRFAWSVKVGGKEASAGGESLTLEPGFGKELEIEIQGPKVKSRTEGELTLRVTRDGDAPFEDTKRIAFHPPVPNVKARRAIYLLEKEPRLGEWLSGWGLKATPIESVTAAPSADGIVIVGPDYLAAEQATSGDLAAYAAGGGRVICLEQEHPLQGAGLPVEVKATAHQAYYAFGQGLGSPILLSLGAADLSNWNGPGPTAKNVYVKPGGAARSWVECGDELNDSALLEVPCGPGVMIVSQLCIGGKLDSEPAARTLLANAIRYCDTYQPPSATVALYAPGRPDILSALQAAGCKLQTLDRLEDGLDLARTPILVVEASEGNLNALAASRQTEAFTKGGGWIMLWGLEPSGLEAFNGLLGTKHILRGFRLERVTLEPDPIVAGLGNRDVVLYSDRDLMFGDKFLSKDVFTYVVDGADIAPFCRVPGEKDGPYEPTYDDKDPFNFVNGITGHDFWRYIVQIWTADWPPEGSPPFVFGLPEPAVIDKVRVWNNAFYNTIEDLEVQVDGRKATTVKLPDAAQMTEVDLKGMPAEQSVAFVVRSIRVKQDKPLVGIDNVQIIRELPNWYKGRVVPLVNDGGLVKYPRGKGGFVLNQIKLMDGDLAENKAKKSRVVSTILRNLGASFAP